LIYAHRESRPTARILGLFSSRKKKACLFLDADGVLWEDNGPGTILRFPEIRGEARDLIFRFSKNKDHLVIVVTNQTSAARNLISLNSLRELLFAFFQRSQDIAKIDAVYACFHHPTAENLELSVNCSCRKPSPEMIYRASRKFNIDLSKSFFVGDRVTDMQSANLAGVGQSFLLVNSKMFEVNIQSFLPKDRKGLNSVFLPVSSLSEVCELVLSIKNPGQ
jgi:D-glycero-D-manno-heptose 1,7-bisphosphate phosphatase